MPRSPGKPVVPGLSTTPHTNDSATLITRLPISVCPAYLLNSTILWVMAQRLVRTRCNPQRKQSLRSGREGELSW